MTETVPSSVSTIPTTPMASGLTETSRGTARLVAPLVSAVGVELSVQRRTPECFARSVPRWWHSLTERYQFPDLPKGFVWQYDPHKNPFVADRVCAIWLKKKHETKVLGIVFRWLSTYAYSVTFADQKWVWDEAKYMQQTIFGDIN